MNNHEETRLLAIAEHYFRSNSYELADSILKKIITSNPHHSKANELLAYIAGNSGNNQLAHQLLLIACQQSNCSAEAFYYLGSSYLKLNQHYAAIKCLEDSIKKAGKYFEALHDMGLAYANIAKYHDAIRYFSEAHLMNPNSFEVLTNLGNSYINIRNYDQALLYQGKAIDHSPGNAECWLNRGVTLHELKRYDAALAHYDQAIQLKPDYAEAWASKGASLHELKRYDAALAHYGQAIQLKPDLDFLLGYSIHTKLLIGNWMNLDDEIGELFKKMMANENVAAPFPLLTAIDSPELHLQAAKSWVNLNFSTDHSLSQIPKNTHGKIRIGYFSADFGNHPVSILTAELFEIHDRNHFEVFGFSLGRAAENDETRRRLVLGFDHFIDLEHESDVGIANLARELEIDIAIDLGGHTQGGRTGIFSCRAAPIQVNYLGYPGTLGAEYFDYIIADKIVIPESNQKFFSEKIVYLPDSYIVDDSKRKISQNQLTRAEFDLPETGFIFCCFNNSYKIRRDNLKGWARILSKVDNSVIWLSENNQSFRENLLNEFSRLSIPARRIIFASRLPSPEDHLARHGLADLFLDTSPYNAHTTAMDALRAGLPVITYPGKAFAGRVAASILSALELPELITNSQDEYELLAVELATNPGQLNAIKEKLATNRRTAPLFNTRLFAKNIEAAYRRMYDRYQADLPPDHLYIESQTT